MTLSKKSLLVVLASGLVAAALTTVEQGNFDARNVLFDPVIPLTWDSAAIAEFELPLATPRASPVPISQKFYYALPERVIYKTYPVYHPDHEPKGYQEWLRNQEPEVVFDSKNLKTESDWIKAGEMLFDYPIDTAGAIVQNELLADKEFYTFTDMPVTKDGVIPFMRYVVQKKGTVKLGNLSCGMCHTRVIDGMALKGAQGNFPGDRATSFALRGAPDRIAGWLTRTLFSAPWLPDDPHAALANRSDDEIRAAYAAVPSGAFGRQGTSILFPPQVQDLIGVKDRKYLDHGGLGRHRDIGDMMRYIAMNQSMDFLNSYDGYIPIGIDGKTLPAPDKVPVGFGSHDRYSEAQLYAIAMFVYSLTPPSNPNRPDAQARRGEVIFKEQGCVTCHTPPLYTNNMLTPADGFNVPEEHWDKYDVFGISVGTDPSYTLKTRRGTGYYKVPSLKGVWYRGPFFHNAWLATLEDVFDPRRLREDYVPTAFRGDGVTHQAVKGHEFGLNLSEKDKKALIAFLKTL